METFDLATAIIQQNDYRNHHEMSGTLPGWAVSMVHEYQHQQELLKTPDRWYLCEKTGQRFKCGDPQFQFRYDPIGKSWYYQWQPTNTEINPLTPMAMEPEPPTLGQYLKPYFKKWGKAAEKSGTSELLVAAISGLNVAAIAPVARKSKRLPAELAEEMLPEKIADKISNGLVMCIYALEKELDGKIKIVLP